MLHDVLTMTNHVHVICLCVRLSVHGQHSLKLVIFVPRYTRIKLVVLMRVSPYLTIMTAVLQMFCTAPLNATLEFELELIMLHSCESCFHLPNMCGIHRIAKISDSNTANAFKGITIPVACCYTTLAAYRIIWIHAVLLCSPVSDLEILDVVKKIYTMRCK